MTAATIRPGEIPPVQTVPFFSSPTTSRIVSSDEESIPESPLAPRLASNSPKLRRVVLPALIAGLAMSGTTAILSPENAKVIVRRLVEQGTGSSLVGDRNKGNAIDKAGPGIPQTLQLLRATSGLTVEEIAAALGVSRRTIHHWESGARVSARNAQRLSALVTLVNQVNAPSAIETRSRLLAPDRDGSSHLGRFAAERQATRKRLATHSVADLLYSEDRESSVPEIRPGLRRSALKARSVDRRGQAPEVQ